MHKSCILYNKDTGQFSTGDLSTDAHGKLIACNVKPIDMKRLSIKKQAFLEAIREQSAMCAGAGDDTYTVTSDMVQAKIAEKKKQKNAQKTR